MFVSVRNTFLHEIVDLQAIENGDEQMRRRAKSVGSVLLQGQEVIALEQASISSLKEWFGRSSGMQEQAPAMKKSLSNSSLSTVCMEGDGEVDSLGEEVYTFDHARSRVEQEFEAKFGRQSDDVEAPKAKMNFAEEFAKNQSEAPLTTMMMRNIPNRYTQQELAEELEDLGFKGSFDFLHAPIDFKTMGNKGYAFVNFVSAEWASRCQQEIDGYCFLKHQQKKCKKVAKVSVAHLQGLEANIAHYQHAAVTTRSRRGPLIMAKVC